MTTSIFLVSGFCLLFIGLSGCAAIKEAGQEAGKDILGISTRGVESVRNNAIKKEFNYAYAACFDKVKKGLAQRGCYIYALVPRKQLIAVYVSYTDTTPVGVFFKEVDAAHTQVEVSSQSTYGKEFIARRVSYILEDKLEPGTEEKKEDATAKEDAATTVANP